MTPDLVPALAAYLSRRIGGQGPLVLSPISGGQSNPTFYADWGARRLVLRKKPPGALLPGAHAIEREYRVLIALAATDVPVPRTVLLEEEASIIGTPFYLMERVEGRVFSDCALPGMSPRERRAIYLAMADALAKLHAVDPEAVGLASYGKPASYIERQIALWSRQWRESGSAPIPELDAVMAWLAAHMPPQAPPWSIAHGDFRLGNLMFHPTRAEVVAILDWELSTLGNPLADLGFVTMSWRTAPDEYGGILGLDHAAIGIPSAEEFIARYAESLGRAVTLDPFYSIFALFRFAVIFVGIAERARRGNAAAENAAEVGTLAQSFARRACALAEA